MSIDDLASDPLRFYTVATVATVIVTTGLLALLRLPGAWIPLRTWFVILPIALGAMWLGQGFWTVLVAVVSIVAFKEYARVTGLYRQTLFVVPVYGAVVTEKSVWRLVAPATRAMNPRCKALFHCATSMKNWRRK